VAEALPPDCLPELADDLGLLTSELVTNAIRYGTRPADAIELVLWPADGHYWLAVSDPGLTLPTVASPGHDACGGRGLLLVDAVSTFWAVVPRRTCGNPSSRESACPAPEGRLRHQSRVGRVRRRSARERAAYGPRRCRLPRRSG
jgi:hypothetical protein